MPLESCAGLGHNRRPNLDCGRSSGVEHNLAKVRVGRSIRLARSKFPNENQKVTSSQESWDRRLCRLGYRRGTARMQSKRRLPASLPRSYDFADAVDSLVSRAAAAGLSW